MPKHVNLPGFVPLHKYLSPAALEALNGVCWLAISEKSDLSEAIQDRLAPEGRDQYVEALREVTVLAQEALKKIE